MSSDNNGNDNASGDNVKPEDHTAADSWASWMPPQAVTPAEAGSSYEHVKPPIPNLPDDVASVLCPNSSFLPQSALTDDSLSLSFGSLSVVCSSALNVENNSWKDNDPVLSLSDAINTSDDIKSNNSCLSFGGSVACGTGAVSKKVASSISQKVSKLGMSDKCLKIGSKSTSSQPDHAEPSEESLSPSASAPPPPPPTPNVLAGDVAHDSDILPPNQSHYSGIQCPSSLPSWPSGSSIAASLKKPTSGIVGAKAPIIPPMKDGVKSSNLMSLLSSAATDSNSDNVESAYLGAVAAAESSYLNTHETVDVTSSHDSSPSNMSSVKSIAVERCSSLVSKSNVPSCSLVSALPVSCTGSVHPVSASICPGTSTGSTSHVSLVSSSSSTASSSLSSNVGPDHVTSSSSSSGAEVMPVRTLGPELQNLPATVGDAAELHHQHHLSHQLQQQRVAVHNAKAGPMYNWQATLTTVKERFAFLFNNEILSDVQFVVGRGEEEQIIPAHKFVLAVGSAVFDAMFNGQLASQQQVIHLPDVEPQAFLALLSFLYSDEVQIGPETVMTVLYTAKKYAVPALERRCVDFLKTNLSSDNAFMLLTQARLFDEPQLAALCLKTIDKCTAEAIVAEGFTDIDHETLTQVLQRDTLRIKELHLFRAVCRWAEAECGRQGCGQSGRQQRSVLGHALKLIRFPLMSVEEFAQGPAQSGILTDAEVVQLFLYFSVNPKPSVDFIDVPRCCMTGKEQTVCRFQSIEARWGYSGTPDRIRFIVDRRIFVVGFGMYGSIHGPSEYEVVVQLIHTLTGKVCGSNETVFTSDGSMNTFRVMFPDPIEVLPNTNYTAYATLKGPDSHYGTKGLRKVVVECPSGDRVCFQFSYAAGNNNGTSVEDGQIPEIIFHT